MLSSSENRALDQESVLSAFLAFREQLSENLLELDYVLGLVFVGSAADTSRVDRWSDHDFFVITKPGFAEEMRNQLNWLPNVDNISFATRETAHGLKVVYRNGHVLEFAVFNDEELELAGGNVFDVFIDKGEFGLGSIHDRMNKIVERSKPEPVDWVREFELFLAHLLIGVGRARRGELLIARQHICSYALNHLLGLLRQCAAASPGTEEREDNLNRFRRFEQQYPRLGAELDSYLRQDVESCAKNLLKLALRECKIFLGNDSEVKVETVTGVFGWR